MSGFRGRAGARGRRPRRAGRPAQRANIVVPPPACGKQKSRNGAAAVQCPETRPRGGLLAQPQRQQPALFGRELLEQRVPVGRRGRGAGLTLAPRRGADALEQFLERPHAQVLRVVERRAARGARDLFVVRAVREQPLERLLPRPDVLRGHLRHRHHLLVHPRLVALDGPHRQQVGHAHLGFRDAAHVARHHRHAAQHGFEHDARTRLGPQRRHQQHARARQQLVDVVHRLRARARWGARRARRGPARWCPRWGRRRTARPACVRRAPGRSEMPFTAHGFTRVTNSFSKRPRSGHGPGSSSEMGTCTASMPACRRT